MALLGKYWDKISAATIVGSGGQQAYQTYQHSLGTTPDGAIPVVRSIAIASCVAVVGALGGNASIATGARFTPSLADSSSPTVSFDLFVVAVHSLVK